MKKIVLFASALCLTYCSFPSQQSNIQSQQEAVAEEGDATLVHVHNEKSFELLKTAITNKESFILVASNKVECKPCKKVTTTYYSDLETYAAEKNMKIFKIMPVLVTGRFGDKTIEKINAYLKENKLDNGETAGKVTQSLKLVSGLGLLKMPFDVVFIKGVPVSNDLSLIQTKDPLSADLKDEEKTEVLAEIKKNIEADQKIIQDLLVMNDEELATLSEKIIKSAADYQAFIDSLTEVKEAEEKADEADAEK